MFDIGWTELLVIGVVALIVVGPKDLPGMFRTLGQFTAKARGMAREFSKAMEDAADETGVKDISKDLKNMTSARNLGLDAVKDAATKFEKWDPLKSSSVSTTDKGPATEALSKERAEAAKKVNEASAKRANARLAAEAKASDAASASAPETKTTKTAKKADAASAALEKPAKPAGAKKPPKAKPAAKKAEK